MTVGANYEQLPMHCTIMHRFHTEVSAAELKDNLTSIVENSPPITLVPVKHQAFGPKKQLATMIQQTPALLELHTKLYNHLNETGVQYTESDWVGKGYIPHVTDKHGKRLSHSKPILSRAIYLISVEHPLTGSSRYVEAKIALDATIS